MSKEIQIVIPEFIQEMQMTKEGKRKLYYEKEHYGLNGEGELPKKYQTEEYIWKKNRLFNVTTKKFVVRNAAAASTPRFRAIAGNDVWARVHPRIRMAMVDAIKNNFRPYLPKRLDLKLPIQIDLDVYTPPRYCDWDIGNLWVYDKVFQDLLVDEKLIPDDNIIYVTKASGPRFIPIVKHENRKMVFTLREEEDQRVLSHVMYDLHNIKQAEHYDTRQRMLAYALVKNPHNRVFTVQIASDGEAGSILTDDDNHIIYISTGKKINYAKVRRGFVRTFSAAVQLNAILVVSSEVNEKFHTFIQQEFVERGLTVYVYGSGDKV